MPARTRCGGSEFELGRSGRVYRRNETIAVAPQPIEARLPLAKLEARAIAPNVALVTYVSQVPYGASTEIGNRSSLWSREENWRLRFHQGTAVPL